MRDPLLWSGWYSPSSLGGPQTSKARIDLLRRRRAGEVAENVCQVSDDLSKSAQYPANRRPYDELSNRLSQLRDTRICSWRTPLRLSRNSGTNPESSIQLDSSDLDKPEQGDGC